VTIFRDPAEPALTAFTTPDFLRYPIEIISVDSTFDNMTARFTD
jgi:hypothetical protein